MSGSNRERNRSHNVTRDDFIRHLRSGDEAIVARGACFAKSRGNNESRLADMAEARGDVHARGAVFVSADDGLNSRDHWPAMKSAAKVALNAFKNMKNGSVRKYSFTDAQVKTAVRIVESKKYKNDPERLEAMRKEGIVMGRTFMWEKLPIIARERGLAE